MLCWRVLAPHGQRGRYVQAPNQPTALSMLIGGERLVDPGKRAERVAYGFRVDVYEGESWVSTAPNIGSASDHESCILCFQPEKGD